MVRVDYHAKPVSYLVEVGTLPVVDKWCRCEDCWLRRDACANYYMDSVHAPSNPVCRVGFRIPLYDADKSSNSNMLCNKQPKFRGMWGGVE